MVNKSGQIKIQQMIFMIVAVFILFAIIGLIALSSKMSNLKKSATELERENALSLVSKLANSPEFYCGNSYGNQKSDCIDFDKAMALKNKIEDYEKFWGVSNIEIRIIPNENILCIDDNYPNCDTLKLISDEITGNSVSNFVSVCYKESNGGSIVNKCEIGQIIVSYEAVQ